MDQCNLGEVLNQLSSGLMELILLVFGKVRSRLSLRSV